MIFRRFDFMSSLTNRYAIFVKKEDGFEKLNEQIIRVLETDDWRADRNKDQKFIVLRTNNNRHIYRNEVNLKEHILSLLGNYGKNKEILNRIVLVKESK